jgi:hypothetical protein
VHGIVKNAKAFLLPWLTIHVPLIVGMVVAFIIVIVIAQPIEYRAFALIPGITALITTWCWIKVIRYFL